MVRPQARLLRGFAVGTAVALLVLGNLLNRRWGI
jgi:hypothetical protein